MLTPLTASATSTYDDLLRTTPDLLLKSSASDPGVDVSNDWYSIIKDTPTNPTCTNSFKDSLDSALETGEWGISLYTGDINRPSSDPYTETYAFVYWTDGTDGYNRFAGAAPDDYIQNATGATPHREALLYTRSDDPINSPVHVSCRQNNFTLIGTRPTNAIVPYEAKVFVSNFDTVYPSGYAGVQLPGVSSLDIDGDGLTIAQENLLGTSDIKKDMDGDGLSDYTESQWNVERDDVFCGVLQCAYPDPTVKDIYVEIDWMKDASSYVYKPSSTQLAIVEEVFDDKGINFHADTGQFGGGNELATYTQTLSHTATSGQIDFWDYKNGGDGITANFSSDRNLIWRYMIYGYNYAESTGSSGWAETMGDDMFISGGLIENMSGLVSLDRAIAGTMAHEAGHNLCLSDEQVFDEQPSECVFSGIDNDTYKPQNYESVMNYRYQLTDDDDMGVVDYSDGSNGTDDHNDWDAVMLGMNGFSGTRTALGKIVGDTYISPNGNVYPISPDGSVIIEDAPIPEMLESNKQEQEEGVNAAAATDNVLPTGFSQPVEDDSYAKESTRESDKTTSFDWTTLLGGGAVLAAITLGATWYHIVRRQ